MLLKQCIRMVSVSKRRRVVPAAIRQVDRLTDIEPVTVRCDRIEAASIGR